MVAINKIQPNFFTGAQGINPVQKPVEQPIQPIQAVVGGSNPFAQQNDNEKMGVGLVQSNLQNMSYSMPNGKTSNCNTRWIA